MSFRCLSARGSTELSGLTGPFKGTSVQSSDPGRRRLLCLFGTGSGCSPAPGSRATPEGALPGSAQAGGIPRQQGAGHPSNSHARGIAGSTPVNSSLKAPRPRTGAGVVQAFEDTRDLLDGLAAGPGSGSCQRLPKRPATFELHGIAVPSCRARGSIRPRWTPILRGARTRIVQEAAFQGVAREAGYAVDVEFAHQVDPVVTHRLVGCPKYDRLCGSARRPLATSCMICRSLAVRKSRRTGGLRVGDRRPEQSGYCEGPK